VWEIDQGLRGAADESKISSALIHLDNVRLTVSQACAIGEAIQYFRSKGKKVICYSTLFDSKNGGLPAYVLASYCDAIQLERLGDVVLETLKYDDVLGDGYTDTDRVNLNKIDTDTNALIRKNRNSVLRHQEPIVNDRHYIDTQALNAGLIDSVVSGLTQSEYTLVIQDYVRLLEKSHKNKGNVVAVIPISDDVKDDTFKAICSRSDIRAVVIHNDSRSGIDRDVQKIGNKPVVVYVADQGVGKQHGSLNDAIDRAIKLAALYKPTVRVEIIHPGSFVSHIMKDLLRLGKSMVSIFKRSINYVTTMVYRPE
jgi:vacuolar-type H+-ATPase subunit F/Vma7